MKVNFGKQLISHTINLIHNFNYLDWSFISQNKAKTGIALLTLCEYFFQK